MVLLKDEKMVGKAAEQPGHSLPMLHLSSETVWNLPRN